MGGENTFDGALGRVERAEKQLAELEAEFARKEAELKRRLEARRTELQARSAAAGNAAGKEAELAGANSALKETLELREKKIEELRRLLLLRKEGTDAAPETAAAGEREPGGTLTGEADRAFELLGKERREFEEHYAVLERGSEAREKELLDEIRVLKEAAAMKSREYEKMCTDLLLAREKEQAALSRASSAAIELMELNVFNKSAAEALKEKELEINDLKRAYEKTRADAAGGGSGR
ncbi:MAG: hypothetical protein HY550_11380 [Elusimicrobia bacterium]|nr:hypothetical protein [Elusimicrobiota bacterium]